MKNKTILMGILNVTPDSFSDGGAYFTSEAAIQRAEEMMREGADIIDIGGESTRPGSESITVDEELRRVLPVIQKVHSQHPQLVISIDTNKSNVALEAMKAGAKIVNSLGGFRFDEKLADVIAQYDCRVIIYHIKGKPRTMQKGEIHYDDVIKNIGSFFEEQIETGLQHGMQRDQFIVDPGIGFGKTVEQNLEIIRRLDELHTLKLPIAIGVSRKSHLGKLLQEELDLETIPGPLERLETSLAETAIAVMKGASIVRTHDVLETNKFLQILNKLI